MKGSSGEATGHHVNLSFCDKYGHANDSPPFPQVP
jgi:hypothetical protein